MIFSSAAMAMIRSTGGSAGIPEISSEVHGFTPDITVNLGITGAQDTGLGIDVLVSIESVFSGDGNDRLTGNAFANSLGGNGGSDRLLGGGGKDWLSGGTGNDSLFGGDGNDSLSGELGNDLYSGGAGVDRAILYNDGGVVVNLALTTAQNTRDGMDTFIDVEDILSGDGSDQLIGNARANVLDGSAGNDTLNGAAGNDALFGGLGNDTFVFNTTLGAGNIDTIGDFNLGNDSIRLKAAIFAGLSVGALPGAAFRANMTGLAADDTDRIIYEKDTGKLYFDADGDGAGARVQFAELTLRACCAQLVSYPAARKKL